MNLLLNNFWRMEMYLRQQSPCWFQHKTSKHYMNPSVRTELTVLGKDSFHFHHKKVSRVHQANFGFKKKKYAILRQI